MQSGDNENSPIAAAALGPGDRVRIQHDPKLDREYRQDEAPKRAALDGLVGIIRARSAGHGLCFLVVTDDGRGAWFEPSELPPIAPAASAGAVPRVTADEKAAIAKEEWLASREAPATKAGPRHRAKEAQTTMEQFYIITGSEDGIKIGGPLTAAEVQERITPDKDGETCYGNTRLVFADKMPRTVEDFNDPRIVGRGAARDSCRLVVILRGSIVVPEAVARVTEYKLPG